MPVSSRSFCLALLVSALSAFAIPAPGGEISTVAGTGERGFDGDSGPGKQAELNNPFGVIVGPDGDVYFCDTGNHVIRKISRKSGKITTVAGTGGVKGYAGDGGPATEAKLFEPYELRFHPGGDLYWVEMQNHLIRKLDARTGIVSTVAGTGEQGFSGDGGPATKATFNRPHSIVFDAAGENLFICDIGNQRIRRLSLETGIVETWCGNGKKDPTPDGAKISPDTPLKGPRALDRDGKGDLWLALREGNEVYRIDMKAGTLHHVAGTGEKGFTGNGGPAKKATLSGPKGVAISPDDRMIYLADTESHTVRAIDLSKNPPTLELIAGDGKKGDGPDAPDPLKCRMARLHGVGVDPITGDLYIGDSETNKIRKITGLPGGKSPKKLGDFETKRFEIGGRKALVTAPEKAAPGNPWMWRCRFYGAFPAADIALLERGWHIAFIDVANEFGGPKAMAAFDEFYAHVTGDEWKLHPKPVMEGFSRGGLPAMNWAIANPDKVAGVYIDAPVLDIHSWPKPSGGKIWQTCLAAHGLTAETADTWKGPLDNLKALASSGVPILSVCGGADPVVPFAENSGILEMRYQKLGGDLTVIVKAACDHHPHSLHDPTPIVEWAERVVADQAGN
ncbi:MAG: hypothetical protein HKN23_09630 [Verrucomicrobiales bacterium]|nr:hypothetical protein [Verrucomicrobiales bacterium]